MTELQAEIITGNGDQGSSLEEDVSPHTEQMFLSSGRFANVSRL
jgi:hypothetical protein